MVLEKQRAIELRKKGYSYNEILREIDVAKSSLSLWLKDTPLSENEKRLLKTRIRGRLTLGRLKAAAAHRANREKRDRLLFEAIKKLFYQYKNEPLFFMGIILYWAEGSHRSSSFIFTNSDPDMMNVMLDWTERYFNLPRAQTKVRLYVHKPYAHERCEEYWSQKIKVPLLQFQKTIFKPTGKLIKKRPNYKGCLRIEITNGLAVRRMSFLIRLFLDDYRKNGNVVGTPP